MATHPAQEGSARTPVRAWPRCFPREPGYGPAVGTASSTASRWQRRRDDALVVPAPGTRRGSLGRRPERDESRGRDLSRLSGTSADRRWPWPRERGGAFHRRCAVRDVGVVDQGPVRRRVPRATGPGRHGGGHVAALRQLRDSWHEALAHRRCRGRRPTEWLGGQPADSAARRPDDVRHQGPGRALAPGPVAPVGVPAPARRPTRHRPDDDRVRHQRRRPRLAVAGHRAGSATRHVGPTRRSRHRRPRRRGGLGRVLRRSGHG